MARDDGTNAVPKVAAPTPQAKAKVTPRKNQKT